MGIVVKHSGSPSVQAAASFGAAQGIRRSQMEDERLRMAQREAELMRQQAFQRETREDEQSFRADEARTSREFQRESNLESAGIQHQYGTFNQNHNAEIQRRAAEEAQGRRKEQFQWEYTEQQRRMVAEQEEGFRKAQESGEYTEDELKEIRNQIDAKQMGIQPSKKLSKKSPYPEGQGIGEQWTDPAGDFVFSRDQHGNVKKIAETNKNPTWKDRIEARKMFVEQFRNAETDTVDYEAVEREMQKMFGGASAAAGAQSGAEPAGAQPEARTVDTSGSSPVAGIQPPKLDAVEPKFHGQVKEAWGTLAKSYQDQRNAIIPKIAEFEKARKGAEAARKSLASISDKPTSKDKKKAEGFRKVIADFEVLDARLRLDTLSIEETKTALKKVGGIGHGK